MRVGGHKCELAFSFDMDLSVLYIVQSYWDLNIVILIEVWLCMC